MSMPSIGTSQALTAREAWQRFARDAYWSARRSAGVLTRDDFDLLNGHTIRSVAAQWAKNDGHDGHHIETLCDRLIAEVMPAVPLLPLGTGLGAGEFEAAVAFRMVVAAGYDNSTSPITGQFRTDGRRVVTLRWGAASPVPHTWLTTSRTRVLARSPMNVTDLDEFDQRLARHLLDVTFAGRLHGRASEEQMTAYVLAGIKAYREWQVTPIQERMGHPRFFVTTAIEHAIPGHPLYDEIAENIGDCIRGVDAQMRSAS